MGIFHGLHNIWKGLTGEETSEQKSLRRKQEAAAKAARKVAAENMRKENARAKQITHDATKRTTESLSKKSAENVMMERRSNMAKAMAMQKQARGKRVSKTSNEALRRRLRTTGGIY